MSDWPTFEAPPGMHIRIIDDDPLAVPVIHTRMDVADADNPDETVTTRSYRRAPLDGPPRNDRDRFELAREVYAHAAGHWMHEFDEWFRMDGVRLHEPHEASNISATARREET